MLQDRPSLSPYDAEPIPEAARAEIERLTNAPLTAATP